MIGFPVKPLLALPLPLAMASPVQAGPKAYFESAVMDCISYTTKMNCNKADGASKTYADRLRRQGDENCAAIVDAVGALAMSAPLVDVDDSIMSS